MELDNRRSSFVALLAAVVLPAVIVMAIYATPFVRDPSTLPFGQDTAGYIWRSNVAHELGLPALRDQERGSGDRPGHAAIVAILRALTGLDGLTAAWIMPLVMSAAVSLAAGALVFGCFGTSGRAALAAAVGVGGSTLIAWTAVGYAANLMFDVVAVAFAAVLIHAMRGRPGSLAASAVLLGGATAIHWVFSVVMLAVVGGVVLAHELWPARLLPDAPVTHPRRPTLALSVGIASGMLAILMVPELPGSIPEVEPDHIANFNSLRLESFHLPLLAGLGVVGLCAGLFRRRERWGVSVLACWAITAGVGLAAWSVFHVATPPYRWIGFALGLPLLAALSGPWLADRFRVNGMAGRAAIAVIALIPAGLVATSGAQVWWDRTPVFEPAMFAELGTVESYLGGSVPMGTPVRVSIRPGSRGEAASQFVRAGLPGARALDADTIRLRYRRGFSDEPIDPQNGVVLHLLAFRPRPPPIGTLLGPGVWLLQGPVPRGVVTAGEIPRAPGAVPMAALGVGWLSLLGLAGYGWTGPLGLPAVARVGLAPAFGIAATVLASVLLARAGVRPSGGGAVLIATTAAGVGWGWSFLVSGRRGNDVPQPDR